ncbi:hypothetical protein [Citrobacter sp. Cb220]|uniref:hypothetical protein n=1 Tax=Citrobacter sp. Cb220 TaxID=2985034 RepID=UPI002575EA60|nr:hypothetical protein [Citrobacter sp. Cb220]MDM3314049.1 hypothetical protein [Citrobacter sp. Cb220]
MNLAAFWGDLLGGNFSKIFEAIAHAHWANVWAAISAIFTALAVIVAWLAMLRWRKQDELRSKLEFKSAISRLAYNLSRLPEKIDNEHVRKRYENQLQELKQQMADCTYAWLASEGLIEKYPEVKKNWDELNANINKYFWGHIKSDQIGYNCAAILKFKFVYK